MEISAAGAAATLEKLPDPAAGRTFAALGYIKNVATHSGSIQVRLAIPAPASAHGKLLLANARAVLNQEFPGAAVELSTEWLVPEAVVKPGTRKLAGVRNIICVASGKGGVGKSTIAANLALAFGREGAATGLIDADIYGPSIPIMLGVHERPTITGTTEQKMVPPVAHGIHVMSMGFMVPQGDAVMWRGPMLQKVMNEFLMNVAWGALDYLILDLPPGTGDIQLTLGQSFGIAGAVIVTTPQDVALADVTRAKIMFDKLELPVLGIVENMSYFVCDGCGHRAEIFSHGGGEFAAKRLEVPFLGRIPLESAICEGGDAGRPIVIQKPGSPAAQAFHELANTIAADLAIKSLKTNFGRGKLRVV